MTLLYALKHSQVLTACSLLQAQAPAKVANPLYEKRPKRFGELGPHWLPAVAYSPAAAAGEGQALDAPLCPQAWAEHRHLQRTCPAS